MHWPGAGTATCGLSDVTTRVSDPGAVVCGRHCDTRVDSKSPGCVGLVPAQRHMG